MEISMSIPQGPLAESFGHTGAAAWIESGMKMLEAVHTGKHWGFRPARVGRSYYIHEVFK